MNQWILVADASRARLFSVSESSNHDHLGDGQPPAWVLEQELEHPKSRAKVSELVSGQQGRSQQSGNHNLHPAMSERTDPKEVEAEVFARQLAEVLHQGNTHNRFERLVLIAPPHFLGLLRSTIDPQVAKRVVLSLDKDYTHLPLRELTPHVSLDQKSNL